MRQYYNICNKRSISVHSIEIKLYFIYDRSLKIICVNDYLTIKVGHVIVRFRDCIFYFILDMNKETAVSWTPCWDFAQSVFPRSIVSPWEIILADNDAHAHIRSIILISSHYNILLITERSAFPMYRNIMTRDKIGRFHLMDISSQLSESSLLQFTQNKYIHALHIILSFKEYQLHFDSMRVSNAIHAIITLLTSMAVPLKLKVFLYKQHHSCKPMYTFEVDNDSTARHLKQDFPSPGALSNHIYTISNNKCACDFDYTKYKNIFLKSVDIYIYTFEKLYNLKVIRTVY